MDSYSHYDDIIMGTMASQITSLTIVYLSVYSGADQRKHQASASLAYVRGIHRWPVNSPHQWPVTRKMFPFDDVIMTCLALSRLVPKLVNETPVLLLEKIATHSKNFRATSNDSIFMLTKANAPFPIAMFVVQDKLNNLI